MNNDLISRDAAVQLLRDKASGYAESMFTASGECNVARVVATECAADIMNLPAVDAEPVKHGKWEFDNHACGYYMSGCVCSLCGYGVMISSANYCPNCGAKMDLEAQNE